MSVILVKSMTVSLGELFVQKISLLLHFDIHFYLSALFRGILRKKKYPSYFTFACEMIHQYELNGLVTNRLRIGKFFDLVEFLPTSLHVFFFSIPHLYI